jgi:RHS repeat-associated protein
VNSAWTWDSLGRLTASSDGTSGAVAYGYDLAGNNTSITYPGGVGHTVQRGFDDASRLASVTDWNGNQTTFTPDPDSNLTATNFAGGTQVDSYGFDNADRNSSSTIAVSGTTTLGLTYTRDNAGLLTKEQIAGGAQTQWGYNTLNQLTKKGGVVTWTYDPADNLTKRSDASTQAFDAANELCFAATQTGGTCASPPTGATTFSYDTRGNRVGSNAVGSPPAVYSYDQANRLVSATVPSQAGATGEYTAVTPARVADTRTGLGTCSPSPCARLAANATTTVQVGGVGGIPSTGVGAVQFSITAVGGSTASSLVAYPTSASATGNTVSFDANETVSNLAIVKPSSTGLIKVTARGAVDFYIDVVGWYATGAGTDAAVFNPVDPARVMSTATGSGTCSPSPCARLAAGVPVTVQVGGLGGVPSSGVSSVAINLTTGQPGAAGGLSAYQAGSSPPADAQVNYGSGEAITGLVITAVDANGAITLQSSSAVDVALDVQGYFNANTTAGDIFTPLSSARILDTRPGHVVGTCTPDTCGTLQANTPLHLKVLGVGGVPATGVAAVLLSVTDTGSTAAGNLTTYRSDATRPIGADVAYNAGETITNTAIVKPGPDGTILLYATSTSNAYVDVAGYFSGSATTTTYGYNGAGLRINKSSVGASTSFAWDKSVGELPLLLTEATGSSTVSYLYDPLGNVFEQVNTDGTTYWYHHDQLGSIRQVTNTAGAVLAKYSYDAYGIRSITSGSFAAPFGFAGGYTDGETGFLYLQARYYDSATSQFLSRDPLGAVTRQPYSYVGNTPLNGVDPGGASWYSLLWDTFGPQTLVGVSTIVHEGSGFVAGAAEVCFALSANPTCDEVGQAASIVNLISSAALWAHGDESGQSFLLEVGVDMVGAGGHGVTSVGEGEVEAERVAAFRDGETYPLTRVLAGEGKITAGRLLTSLTGGYDMVSGELGIASDISSNLAGRCH